MLQPLEERSPDFGQFYFYCLQCFSNAFLMINQNCDHAPLSMALRGLCLYRRQTIYIIVLNSHVYLQRKVHKDIVYMH